MSDSEFVFLDAKGRRWLWARLLTVFVLLTTLVLLIAFIRALLVKPELYMPTSIRTMKLQLKAMAQAHPDLPSDRPWQPFEPKTPRPAATPANQTTYPRVTAALLEAGDPRSLNSLLQHASSLTHICPEIMNVNGQPPTIRVEADVELMTALHNSKLQIFPVLTNFAGDHPDTDTIEGLLQADWSDQKLFIDQLQNALRNLGASGVLLDWQGIDPALSAQLTAFLGKIRDALHTQNRELWLSIPVGDDLRVFDLDHLPDQVDRLVAQLHDKNAEDDPAGPVASQPWFEGWLQTLLDYGDSDQWILSLGSYGYDWNQTTKRTATISFGDAMARAQRAGVGPISSVAPDYAPGFSYDSQGDSHAVWFLDASTMANELRAGMRAGCGGVLVNQLGNEDPGIWPLLTHRSAAAPPASLIQPLQKIDPGDDIAQIGEGEFLRAEQESAPGRRELKVGSDGNVSETYTQWPIYPTVIHIGDIQSNKVALTFDDGPDPEWTPKILAILQQYHVHATFFILGVHAEAYPDLVRQILRGGNEIGSHTYTHANLSNASSHQITMELNATQRLVEWITGRSIILFRPPYNADSMPAALADVRAIAKASDLGYVTVGESIDPQDWDRPGADEISRRVREQRESGNVILLHDGGGDRSQTVAALPRILDYLRERDDDIVRVGSLIGLDRKQTMPPLIDPNTGETGLVANAGLLIGHWGAEILWSFMIVASGLTVLRSIFLAILAVGRKPRIAGPEYTAPLSIVIAAYNEGKVIEGTLQSVLKTDYKGPLEMIVVDDGSTDDTGEKVTAMAALDPRIHLLRQTNAGKSRALARGFDASSHDTLVFLDADTHFQPDTLRELTEPLNGERVGAVSGHARVGNLKTWVARFQSLEYICGFNLDRRAYDRINGITVVPGAISAFRREAIVEAGGFDSDTLAEDTDLTLSLHRCHWRVTYAPDAIAWTEAPDTVRALARQRFRWAFGTMQCLWKHRDLVFNPRFGFLGCFTLPSVIFFQILLIATIPMVDFLLIISLFTGAGLPFVAYFSAFLLCDLFLAILACRIEEEPLRQAAWIIPMRFLYRPILSWVVWRSILHVMRGAWVGWGKQERKGGVTIPATEP